MTREEAKAFVESFVKLRDLATDAMAWKVPNLYPEWKPDTLYSEGKRLFYGGKLYKVKDDQTHTSLANWTPDIAPTLYERIDETHEGTESDPIPYDGNMVLESGKYYAQDGVTYICTRDTGNAVYHPLAELVGQYVEPVSVQA